MATSARGQLKLELQRLTTEEQRLTGEGRRLRSELRRARAAESIAARLHEDLFSSGSNVREVDAIAASATAEASALHLRLQEAEAVAERNAAEAVELRNRLAHQEAFQAEAAELTRRLKPQHTDEADEEDDSQSGPPTAREARLTRETAELRRQIRFLENRVQELQTANQGNLARPLGSGRQTPSERSEVRRLQQLDSFALRLHEELRKRASECNSKPTSVTSSPPRRHVISHAPSQCGTEVSRRSTKSEMLGQQIEAFYSRFMLRAGTLHKPQTDLSLT